jgi:hypothetical protein
MSNRSEIIVALRTGEQSRYRLRDLLEVLLVFGLILGAIWTPLGHLNSLLVWSAAACVLVFSASGRWSASDMGLTRPQAGLPIILIAGASCCALIALAGLALRFFGPAYHVPWLQSGEYMIWSLAQQFILQSVFFVRIEAHVGARHAVFASAVLYALAHLPSPLLSALSLLGGTLFCELFRRWRNLYPIALIHSALGLTIAGSFPDKWMHHMRVGIGYLAVH